MSTSLLKKSLKLFEEEEKLDKTKSNKTNSKARSGSAVYKKKQATLKDRKVKSALESFIKKNPKEDKTLDNLAALAKISLKNTVSKASTNKILDYHLKKSRKVADTQPKKKEEKSVFTDADFHKFEREYFVKGKF